MRGEGEFVWVWGREREGKTTASIAVIINRRQRQCILLLYVSYIYTYISFSLSLSLLGSCVVGDGIIRPNRDEGGAAARCAEFLERPLYIYIERTKKLRKPDNREPLTERRRNGDERAYAGERG